LDRAVTPPFVATICGLEDITNFDRRFTSIAPILIPQEESLTEEAQESFRDFEWVADWVG
uniref:AGC-kinase C-terminal domain-containing protein n=1 Tax=Leptobrachium leishanense TaxID=445787 RepID=A0A8C5QR82_9ANUR